MATPKYRAACKYCGRYNLIYSNLGYCQGCMNKHKLGQGEGSMMAEAMRAILDPTDWRPMFSDKVREIVEIRENAQ